MPSVKIQNLNGDFGGKTWKNTEEFVTSLSYDVLYSHTAKFQRKLREKYQNLDLKLKIMSFFRSKICKNSQ